MDAHRLIPMYMAEENIAVIALSSRNGFKRALADTSDEVLVTVGEMIPLVPMV